MNRQPAMNNLACSRNLRPKGRRGCQPGIDPVAVADLNGDELVSAFDAAIVASVVNIKTLQIC